MKEKEIRIFCNSCKRLTKHELLTQTSKSFSDDDYAEMQISFAKGTWQIVGCCGCEAVVFREIWITSEDIDPFTGEFKPIIEFYPPREEGVIEVDFRWRSKLPDQFSHMFGETLKAYNQKLDVLCAAGIRAVIEGISLDKGIRDGPIVSDIGKVTRRKNLQGKIEGLAEAGLLTKKHAETLHQLRFLGNRALHELERPTRSELKLAIEIIMHTIDNLYLLPMKAGKLKK